MNRSRYMSTAERFWSKVAKAGPDDCWLWIAATSSKGYGSFRLPEGSRGAHRVSWALHNGQIPMGLYVLHACEDRYDPSDTTGRRCVNPAHLKLGTQTDNMADRERTGRAIPTRARGDRSGPRLHPDRMFRGEAVSTAKLTADEVRAIRCARGISSQKDLAARYGVCPDTISRIQHRRYWAHVS